jgi:hypothetical protein
MSDSQIQSTVHKAKRKLNIDEEKLTLDHQLNVLKRLYDNLLVDKVEEVESQLKKREVNEFKELTFKIKNDKVLNFGGSITFYSDGQVSTLVSQEHPAELAREIIQNFSQDNSPEELVRIAKIILDVNFVEFQLLLRVLIETPIEVVGKMKALENIAQNLYSISHPMFDRFNQFIIECLEENLKNLASPQFFKAWDDFVVVF